MKSLASASDEEIVSHVRRCVKDFEGWSGKFHTEAREAFDFIAGRQMPKEDEEFLREQNRPPVTFNRTSKFIDAVVGTEVNNKMATRFVVGGIEDTAAVDLLSQVIQQSTIDDHEAESTAAFHDNIVCGMGWTNTRLDYTERLEGAIVETKVDPLAMGWDYSARKRNLSDARWVYEVKRYSCDELRDEFDVDPEDYGGGFGGTVRTDGATPSLMDRGEYDFDRAAGVDDDRDELRPHKVFFFQQMEIIERIVAINPMTGRAEVLDPDKFAEVQRRFMASGQSVPAFARRKQRTCYEAVVCGGKLLKPVEEIGLRTYEPITGKWDRNLGVFFGAVRVAKDPQRWENKFFSNILHVMSSAGKGLFVEEDAIPARLKREFERDLARPDKIKYLNPGAISQSKIQQPAPTPLPPGVGDMLQFSVNAVPDVLGLSPEFLGLAGRTQSGIVERSRRQAGLAVLAEFFQARREHIKRTGKIKLGLALKYIPDSVFLRIGGQSAVQVLPQLREADFADYDVRVDEAPMSPDQKSEVWGDFMQMLPALVNLQVPREIYALFIQYSPWPASIVSKFVEALSAPPDPMQVQAQKLDMAQKSADIQETQSKAALNAAKAQSEGQPDIGNMLATLAAAKKARLDGEIAMNEHAMKMREMAAQTQHASVKHMMDMQKLAQQSQQTRTADAAGA